MAKGIHSETLQHVRMLFESGAVGGLTDRQLLERFRAREGAAAELAFAVLVERHGPMVLRVCRRTLRDEHDAQDAFQATFLVLVRKAGSLRAHDSLGGWLHAVACRVAACARAAEARRRVRERKAAEAVIDTTPSGNKGWDDLGLVLHEEIGRLPETYRAAVVLCDLEGLTQEQAAQRLGWPSGTVRSRLARGRGRLQARLTRRGFAPAMGTVSGLLTAEAATATVPAALVESTIRAAILAVAGKSLAGAVAAAALSETVLRAMFMTKLKLIFVVVLGIGAGVGGSAVLALPQAEGPKVSGGAPSASGDHGAPKAPEASRPPETPALDPATDIEHQISLAELMLKRAHDRLAWSDRMYVKGYVSKAQNIADKHALKLASDDLALARLKLKVQRPARPPGNNAAEDGKREETDREPPGAILADLNNFWPRSNFDEAELAELPPDGRLTILNWENAYALALTRSRAGQPVQDRVRAEALNLKNLAEQSVKCDIGDFARFRTEFLASQDDAAGAESGFRDPAGAILELLRRRQEVENARWNIAGFENLVKVLKNLIEKVSSGLSQLQLDQAETALQDARLHLLDERELYRVQLDHLKDRLGLSPRAAITLDRDCLAGFRATFEEADRWCADPRREPTALPRIASRLPALDDLVIDGHSAAAAAVAATAAQARSDAEELSAAGVRLALKNRNRGDQGKAGVQDADDGGLEQEVRGGLRRLLRIRVAYEIERRRLVLVVRGKDQAQERLLAPPGRDESPEHRAQLFTELIAIQGQMLETQDRLVSLWTEHQTLRLALFRAFGTLPCDNWKSFYDQLTARPGGDPR